MIAEIFTLCDFAQNMGGKLILIGPFDAIISANVPCIHHTCYVAMRLRFPKSEEGIHEFRLNIFDSDGNRVFPELPGRLNVRVSNGLVDQAVDLAIRIDNLQFPKFGEYALSLALDKREERSVPVRVIPMPSPEIEKSEAQQG